MKIITLIGLVLLCGCVNHNEITTKRTTTVKYTLGGGLFVPASIEWGQTTDSTPPQK